MPSKVLYIIVEGQTEKAGLERLLQSFFCAIGCRVACPVLGGQFRFEKFVQVVKKLCQSNKGCYISTCFDYYGLGRYWPGVQTKPLVEDKYHIIEYLEKEALNKIYGAISNNILWDGHFIPYIQLHEFVTLLFAHPESFSKIMRMPDLHHDMELVLRISGGNCELINDSPASAPSKRIARLTRNKYVKGKSSRAHAPIFLDPDILPTLRSRCRHFHAWLEKLENAIR